MSRLWILITVMLSLPFHSHSSFSVDTITYGPFGKVVIYRPQEKPNAVVLFVSGDGGWNLGVIDMAKNIVAEGAMVAGIDIIRYYRSLSSLSTECYYPAGDFEDLSIMIQKKYHLDQYLRPVLIGYSSGATLVYGILVQAPGNTFTGALSLGFCPDIQIEKPLCRGSGLSWHTLKEGHSYYLEACRELEAPFIVLQGQIDQVCSFEATQQYVKTVKYGELVALPKVGHGFAVQSNWLPQFITAYKKILETPSYMERVAQQNAVPQTQSSHSYSGDLPIFLIPAADRDTMPLAFLISGDGGWGSFDQGLAQNLAERGIPVVGLDAVKYFWSYKTPEKTTSDIAQACAYYMQLWRRSSLILGGYSFGADIVPFVARLFPDTLKRALRGVFSLSPDENADFQVHVIDMLSLGSSKDTFDVVQEVREIEPLHPVCFFGDGESEVVRDKFAATGAVIITLPGKHHYNNNAAAVADAIVNTVIKKRVK